MINLNVNIDHFATLRNAREENNPNIVLISQCVEMAGASGIVAHLRKDQRHIKERDILDIKNNINTPLNLEMSLDILDFACKIKPTVATIVPENDNELTTEGGLDVIKNQNKIENAVKALQDAGVQVSLFIEPEEKQIEVATKIKANSVEFNTKKFAAAYQKNNFVLIKSELKQMEKACLLAIENNLYVSAGHSLNYHNIKEFAKISKVKEYNIGHSIVVRSMFVGLNCAVREMVELIYKTKQMFNNY